MWNCAREGVVYKLAQARERKVVRREVFDRRRMDWAEIYRCCMPTMISLETSPPASIINAERSAYRREI